MGIRRRTNKAALVSTKSPWLEFSMAPLILEGEIPLVFCLFLFYRFFFDNLQTGV